MRRTSLALAVALVRAWTRIYTWNLDPNVQNERRAEIDSDLWEQLHAPDVRATVAFEILDRMLLGIPADLQWRFERGGPLVSLRLVMLATLASAMVVVTVWMMFIGRAQAPQTIPSPPPMRIVRASGPYSPPAPPPPPLCTPNTPPQVTCTRWP